jgi:hypothetical protein
VIGVATSNTDALASLLDGPSLLLFNFVLASIRLKRSILTISKSSSVMILDRMGKTPGSKKDAKKK